MYGGFVDYLCLRYPFANRKMMFFCFFFFLMIRRPPRSTQSRSSAASDVYKRQGIRNRHVVAEGQATSDISVIAAQRALENAGLEAKDIDCLLYTSPSPRDS